MIKSTLALSISAAAFTLLFGSATQALPFDGTEVTIYDGDSNNGYFYGADEDQEVEPGMATGQEWDLEGVFTYGENNRQVGMVGGYDFVNGQDGVHHGDIFIDLHGDYIPGTSETSNNNEHAIVESTFGYEFVLDLDFETFTYDLIALDDKSTTITPYVDANYGSSPWRYNDGGEVLASDVSFSYDVDLSDADANDFIGGSHNVAYGFDLSFLGDAEAWFHFTMACGNDNLMGYIPENKTATEVSEPSAIILSASMMLGLAGLRVRRKKLATAA